MFWTFVVPFLVYWILIYVGSYLVTEFAQNYLYDETTKGLGWRVAIGATILAALLTWTQPSFDTMFTETLASTLLQAVAWGAVFVFLYRFQPLHGAVAGMALMVVLAGTATLAVDSLQTTRRPRPEVRRSAPIRRPASSSPQPIAPASNKAAAPAPAGASATAK
jgi:hypothetical protein